MKCPKLCFSLLLSFSLLISIEDVANVTVFQQKNLPKFISMDETIVYRALTVIEGDILVDKFCECKPERECRNLNRNTIKLTK